MKNHSQKNWLCLLLAILMALSFTSCNDKKAKNANEVGKTTESDTQNLETIITNLAHSRDCFEDTLPEIFFGENSQTYGGTTYYRKWYDPSMVTNANLNDVYNGKVLTFYCYFNDRQINEQMITKKTLDWIKGYINSLDLGIEVEFKFDGTYSKNGDGKNNIIDFDVAGSVAENWHKDEDAWAYCAYKKYGKLTIGSKTFDKVAIAERDIILKPIMTSQSAQRYEFIMLHELGHAFGLLHPDASVINKPDDYFIGESVMAASSADSNIEKINGHAAYYTIDAAALRLLYGK